MTLLVESGYRLDSVKSFFQPNFIFRHMHHPDELKSTQTTLEGQSFTDIELRTDTNEVVVRFENGLEYPVGSPGDEDDLLNHSPTRCPEPQERPQFFPGDTHERIPTLEQIPTTVDDISDTEMGDISPRPSTSGLQGSSRQVGCKRLWEFLRDKLSDPNFNPSHIKWVNRNLGEFKIVKTVEMAQMWGEIKNNTGMTYEKMSRAMRYYYKRKIMAPVLNRRLVYKFGPRSYGWQLNEDFSS